MFKLLLDIWIKGFAGLLFVGVALIPFIFVSSFVFTLIETSGIVYKVYDKIDDFVRRITKNE